MFYCIYSGSQKGFLEWKEHVDVHSCWLHKDIEYLYFDFKQHITALAMIGNSNKQMFTMQDSEKEIRLTLSNSWNPEWKGQRPNGVEIRLSKNERYVTIQVPFSTPEQVYYYETNQTLYASNDQRLLARFAKSKLNDISIFHYLETGCLPSNLSVYEEVYRIPPMHKLVYSGVEKSVRYCGEKRGRDESNYFSASKQIDQRLEEILGTIPGGSKVFFSGGVDSALIAAKLKEHGRSDVTLENYSFGDDDQEAKFAKRVADYIGLPFHQMMFDEHKLTDVLENIGKDYSFPYSDQGTLQSRLMISQSLTRSPFSVAIDGTGADQLFTKHQDVKNWEKVYRLPPSIRKLASPVYEWMKVFESDPNIGTPLRAFKKSTDAPMYYAMIMMNNCLDGVAFHMSKSARHKLLESFYIRSVQELEGLSENEQIAALRVSLRSGALSGAKIHDPLHVNGTQTLYPFLDTEMVKIGSRVPIEEKFKDGEQKYVLKKMLARYLPESYIYRPKNVFLPPIKKVMSNPNVVEWIESEILDNKNPMLSYVDVSMVTSLFQKAKEGKVLSFDIYNFLWSFMMISRWVAQVNQAISIKNKSSMTMKIRGEENHATAAASRLS
ncbi:asparagine synthase C-terminal domain-containing protein [Halobacillus kuroshimensis]|uniref:DUF7411 family protein n=1 Tax=Halobacillus kuroshimensis TaxID=302481 RepID=UPI0004188712|nr:asparagine synthase C-terminal domain-containing protein [Halobacillus kuroshimensis]